MGLGEKLIGSYGRRFSDKSFNWIGRAHKVQSVIQDSIITKCGRRMRETNSEGTLRFDLETWTGISICKQCR